MQIEKKILSNLIQNEEYSRRVLPFIKREYFSDESDKLLFHEVREFILKYNELPKLDTLEIELDKVSGIRAETISSAIETISEIRKSTEKDNIEWLVDTTEKYCQDKAIYNAIMSSVDIINDTKKEKGEIPKLLSDALAVSFDPNVGHDYLEEFTERWKSYHKITRKLPFDLKYFNEITKGGVETKSLNILLAGTAVGKSLAMCHMAAANLSIGKNVLYITLELSEEKVAERIDANLMNLKLDDLKLLPLDLYTKRVEKIRSMTKGKLIVKEYPTATASVVHFRALLNELALKKNFHPDVIYIDYLNICASSRIRLGGSVNTYSYVKFIAEELRGLAVERDLPIWSATQVNRSGFTSSDIGLEDTSESFGLPATADFMVALISNETLESLGQIQVKQLKNRYGDTNLHKRFVLGIDRSKMKLYDVDDSAQTGIADSGNQPVFDNTKAGRNDKFKRLKL